MNRLLAAAAHSFVIALAGFMLSPFAASAKDAVSARADIINSTGKKIGTATLMETKSGVQISLTANDLSPGAHGMHIHEKGSCEGPDFKSAGGHFNPDKRSHGFKNPQGHHAGDLNNITVGSDGTVKEKLVVRDVTLRPGAENSLMQSGGTSLVIHEKADDEKSDPAGNSGGRIACGVIASTAKR
ncbi:MAG: superoxide dismutase family protein [Bdellovibrionia bacterium]